MKSKILNSAQQIILSHLFQEAVLGWDFKSKKKPIMRWALNWRAKREFKLEIESSFNV